MAAPSTQLSEERAEAFLRLQKLGGAVPAAVQDWLGRLALLYGVPFENLVPDVRMLPPESLRFFYLDVNWLEALIDGAFSTGAHSELDIRFHETLQFAIREATLAASGSLRSQLRGEAAPEGAANAVRCGFLLRSQAVSGWPGIEVRALDGPNGGEVVPLLRMDRPAPDTLLCIFADIPQRVEIAEPSEDLHFGVTSSNEPDPASRRLTVRLRSPETGIRLDPPVATDVRFRDRAKGTLDIAALAADLARSSAAPPAGRRFGAGDFGVQMIDAADMEVFTAS